MIGRVEQLNQMNTWFSDQYDNNLFENCNSPADVEDVMRESLQDMNDEEVSGFSVWLDYCHFTFQELIEYCQKEWSRRQGKVLPEGKVYGVSIACPACEKVSLYGYRQNKSYRCSKCDEKFVAEPIDTSGS